MPQAQIKGLEAMRRSGVSVLEDTSGGEFEAIVTQDPGLQKQILEEEVFMNEIVEVYCYPSTNENEPPHFTLSVNGTNQPVFRGSVTPMKRKYLEVLARMKQTAFTQPARDIMNPEAGNQLIGRTALVYPFELRKDPNPRGPAWLAAIVSENQ